MTGAAEVAVIGAGPAGCAAAAALARAGREVLLLDRAAEAREVVCGEFLGPDAAAALARLDLDPPGLGALPLHGLRLGAAGREAAAPLPFPAWSLPRRVLDAALRDVARAAGADLRPGAAVLGAEFVQGGWRLRLAGGGAAAARQVVLATGKHALRGHPRAGAPPGALGLKLHLRGAAMPGSEVVLLPFPGGYAGLQPIPGDGGANLCAALRGPAGEAARGPEALIARVASGSALAARLLAGARPAWDRPLAVAEVPYGFRHRPSASGPPGLYRVGDQAAVIPSCTGEGVAMALLSGLAAAEAILAGAGAPAFHAAWDRRIAAPMRWGGLAGRLLERAPRLLAAAVATSPGAARLVARRTRLGPAGAGTA